MQKKKRENSILQALRILRAPVLMNKQLVFQYLKDACRYGRVAAVEILVQVLTLSDLRTENDFALRLACNNGHDAVVAILIRVLTQ